MSEFDVSAWQLVNPDSSRPLDKSFFVSLIRLDHSLMVKKGKGEWEDERQRSSFS